MERVMGRDPPYTDVRRSNKCGYDLWSETDTYNSFCIKKLLTKIETGVRRDALDMINNLKLLVKGGTYIALPLYTSKYLTLIGRRLIRPIV